LKICVGGVTHRPQHHHKYRILLKKIVGATACV
jgi:hypothetical protein